MARYNWAEMGLTWTTESVKTDHGKTTIAGAEIPTITDLEKFAAALKNAGGNIMDVINASNSPRVMAQDKKRRNPDNTGEALRETVWNGFLGMRGPRAATIPQIMLANGQTYAGTSAIEFQQAYIASAVDIGLPMEVARTIAAKMAASATHLK
jgi:hypothetical protein